MDDTRLDSDQALLAARRTNMSIASMPADLDEMRAPKAEPFNFGQFLKRALRGRYPLVIVLGILCGVAGVFAGLWLFHPTYHSEGLLRIAYELPQVGDAPTDQNGPMVMFDTFMQSQKLLITSRRVIDEAIQDPIWRTKSFRVPADPEHYFAENLHVDIRPRSEYIQISVTDPDPGTAATAVNAIINAYQDVYKHQVQELERTRIGILEDRRTELTNTRDQLRAELGLAINEYGSTQLDLLYASSAGEVARLKSAMGQVRVAMATAPAQGVTPAPPSVADPGGASGKQPDAAALDPSSAAHVLSIEEIAAVDQTMSAKLAEQTKLSNQLSDLQMRGYRENHREVIAVRLALQHAGDDVKAYADRFRRFHAVTAQSLGDTRNVTVLTANKSRETLQKDLQSLSVLLQEAEKEMRHVGTTGFELQRKEKTLAEVQTELDQKRRRIEQLQEQGAIGARLTVIATAEAPLSPDRDRRPVVAAAAGVGGAALPVSAILLLSMLRRRYQYSEDAQMDVAAKLPLLGILPELTEKADAEQMLAAARGIHHIRVLLQAHAKSEGPRSYLITSADAGEGKTSLTMSLGLSFAASRLRTLIIDSDLLGRRLSSALEARELKGLHEALAVGSLRRLVRRTHSGLYVLPAGNSDPADACGIPALGIRTLLDEAQKYFDVVLIDSGPILGSVEAAVLAQEVDGVIFVIARGQQRSLVEKATRRLISLGVRMEGYIFNRAKHQDFENSAYGSSSGISGGRNGEQVASTVSFETATRFGPMVRAVACGVPAMQN